MGSKHDRSMPPGIKDFAYKGTGFLSATVGSSWIRRVSIKPQIQNQQYLVL